MVNLYTEELKNHACIEGKAMASQSMSHISEPNQTSDQQPTKDRSCSMVYSLASQVSMQYSFTNTQSTPLELWLALPPTLPMQQHVRIEGMTPDPVQIQHDDLNLNRLAFFHLDSQETLQFTIRALLYNADYQPSSLDTNITLSEAERAFFLRSSRLIQVSGEVRAEARRIVGDADTHLEQVRRLYLHLIKHFHYQWPPDDRGSEAMRQRHRGDCGQYSFLYAAWCRSLGIPCRVLIGSWVRGHMQAHVWNEVYIDGSGWVPLDSSVHQTALRVPILADIDWRLQRLEKQFGRLAGNRLAFSIDPDIPLYPPYKQNNVSEKIQRLRIGGEDLAWGFESLDGAAPYLQPIYLRMTEPEGIKSSDVLGQWHFKDMLSYRFLTWVMYLAFAVGVLGTTLNLLGIQSLGIITPVAWVLANLVYIHRSGLRWWKLALLGLFAFELVMGILRLIME
ncbi:MAG: hypothetical protein GFH27_549309n143 [Chloroflexi bacterium AL-W]|nr:hypothetical protein [Chloroflexi bacterium AL-N1]NOK69845.1 hypothetical protein [Chloroflexi bacterium AL-N10]NOK73551.1 hypothetical protein [Chloroflexi bacterium AL-N5]NOK84015.1 hypothetical protein [Chloroflexi bacterium AL-W]NOK87882.1 hypothetical protein [Chloroflexi bacterium AL-N15]